MQGRACVEQRGHETILPGQAAPLGLLVAKMMMRIYNHRMVWVGQDFKDHLVPTPSVVDMTCWDLAELLSFWIPVLFLLSGHFFLYPTSPDDAFSFTGRLLIAMKDFSQRCMFTLTFRISDTCNGLITMGQ